MCSRTLIGRFIRRCWTADLKNGGGRAVFKKKKERKEFDAAKYRPVLKCSICHREQVAGFQDLTTGKFEEMALIRNEKELKEFLETYGLETIDKIY